MEAIQQILARLEGRKSRWGIGTAAAYLKSLEGCFSGGACPREVFDLASAGAWQSAIKEASNKLVYCDQELGLLDGSIKHLKEQDPANVSTSDVPEGAIMSFDCVMTSTRRDRDGDKLLTKGAKPDMKMPLLWQHIHIQPIGKLCSLLTRSDSKLTARCAIADTPLGRDAATLVEFGALRISHGFDPLEYEPMEDEKGNFLGWLIKEFEIMEISLASVPSNVDAVILAWDKHKLHHPAVKAYAKNCFNLRQKHGRGMEFKSVGELEPVGLQAVDSLPLPTDRDITIKYHAVPGLAGPGEHRDLATIAPPSDGKANGGKAASDKTGVACSCKSAGSGRKQHADIADRTDSAVKYLGVQSLEGSWEDIRNDLDATLRDYLVEHGVIREDDEYAWSYIENTFDEEALVYVRVNKPEPGDQLYLIAWAMDGDEPKWTGEPRAAELQVSVLESPPEGERESDEDAEKRGKPTIKQLVKRVTKDAVAIKGAHGRVTLKTACGLMRKAMAHDEIPDDCCEHVKNAHDLVSKVANSSDDADSGTTTDGSDAGDQNTTDSAAGFAQVMAKSGEVAQHILESSSDEFEQVHEKVLGAIRTLREALTLRQRRFDDEQLEALLAEL